MVRLAVTLSACSLTCNPTTQSGFPLEGYLQSLSNSLGSPASLIPLPLGLGTIIPQSESKGKIARLMWRKKKRRGSSYHAVGTALSEIIGNGLLILMVKGAECLTDITPIMSDEVKRLLAQGLGGLLSLLARPARWRQRAMGPGRPPRNQPGCSGSAAGRWRRNGILPVGTRA